MLTNIHKRQVSRGKIRRRYDGDKEEIPRRSGITQQFQDWKGKFLRIAGMLSYRTLGRANITREYQMQTGCLI
jgi:hypothetical protein